MAKAFSVLSWNVKHFGATDKKKKKPNKPVKPIIQLLAAQDADVVAIYEVVGSVVFDTIVTEMPGYQFHITEGPQSQEILVGVKKKFTSFFTQKVRFKSGQRTLRPGALLTLKIGEQKVNDRSRPSSLLPPGRVEIIQASPTASRPQTTPGSQPCKQPPNPKENPTAAAPSNGAPSFDGLTRAA